MVLHPTRLTVGIVAGLTAAMLGIGIAAAAVVDDRASRPAQPAASGHLGPSQVGAEPFDDPAVPVAPAPAPAPTAAPSAAPKAAAGSADAPPLPGHRTPGAVVTPFKAGRTEWSGVSNGITIRMVMTPAVPRAGEPVTFVVEASTPAGLCCNLMLEHGDGSEGAYPPRPGLGPLDCARLDPKANSVRGEITHVYNKGGRWNFSLSARTGTACTPSNPPAAYGSLDGTLQVEGGSSAATAQGPARPEIRPASVYPYAPRVITLGATAKDDDGYIDRLVVDWGDGSATQTYKNPQPCKPTPGGWPGGTYTILPLWMGVGPVTHRYADDSPHTVTVTVVSTGCDGSTEQRTSGTVVFPEPLPPPPPFESIPVPPPSNVPPPPPISSLPVPPPGPPPSFPVPPMPSTTALP